MRASAVKKDFGECHIQPVKKDNGASNYCLKEDTRVEGPYEFGQKAKHGGDHKTVNAK